MTDETTAVVPAGESLPSFGAGNIRAENLIPPRVKVVQLMSKERSDGRADAGDFFNTLTGESYGPELKFAPIRTFMNRVLLVRDEKLSEVNAALKPTGIKLDKSSSTLRDRTLDMVQGVGDVALRCDECPLSQWQGREVPPLCTEVYNVAAITELGDLIFLQFQKTSARTGKQMFSMVRLGSAGAAPYARFYEVKTNEISNTKGTFFEINARKLQETPPPELIKQAQYWDRLLQGLGPVDVTPTDDEALDADEEVDDSKGPF